MMPGLTHVRASVPLTRGRRWFTLKSMDHIHAGGKDHTDSADLTDSADHETEPLDPRALIAAQRENTAARVVSLRGQFDAIVDGSAWSTDDDEHDPEGSTIAFERAKVISLARDADAEMRELDAADARVSAGTFGICERCGHAIARERLEALPTAVRCIVCVRSR